MKIGKAGFGGAVFLAAIVLFWANLASLAQSPHPEAKPTILGFTRKLCPMCQEMEQILEQVKAKYGDQIEVQLLHIDVDEKLFKEYGVVFVPTQVFLDAGGRELYRHTGIMPREEMVKKLKELKFVRNKKDF